MRSLDEVHVRAGVGGRRREGHGALCVGRQNLLVEDLKRPIADEAVNDGWARRTCSLLAFELAIAVVLVRTKIRGVVLFAVFARLDAVVLIEGEAQVIHMTVLRRVLHGHEVLGGGV